MQAVQDKVIKLLHLAESPNDNEAILAFRTARKIMRSSGIEWKGFLTASQDDPLLHNTKLELTRLMKMKLQLQQECYAIKDEITKNEVYLRELTKKVVVAENEKEGYFFKRHTPSESDIDEAFQKIFDAIYRFSSKKNEFLESLRSQWLEKKWLSPKQISCLRDNFIKYTGFEPAW
jgi:hypothetical protein